MEMYMMPDNYYIRFYADLLVRTRSGKEFEKVKQRIAAKLAGLMLGRNFGQSVEDYLNEWPEYKTFYQWNKFIQPISFIEYQVNVNL